MRYEAIKFDVSPYWYVWDSRKRFHVASPCIESEADIIAFALNAIAGGWKLEANCGPNEDMFYRGPTDGVAPDA